MECRLNPRSGSFLSACHPRDVHFITTPRTWHPHIYDPPPKQPTPFLISHILGLSDQPKNRDDRKATQDGVPGGREEAPGSYSTEESFKDECKCGGCLNGLKESDNQLKSGSPVTSKDFLHPHRIIRYCISLTKFHDFIRKKIKRFIKRSDTSISAYLTRLEKYLLYQVL